VPLKTVVSCLLNANDVLVKESILHGSISLSGTAVTYISVNVLSDVIVYVPVAAI